MDSKPCLVQINLYQSPLRPRVPHPQDHHPLLPVRPGRRLVRTTCSRRPSLRTGSGGGRRTGHRLQRQFLLAVDAASVKAAPRHERMPGVVQHLQRRGVDDQVLVASRHLAPEVWAGMRLRPGGAAARASSRVGRLRQSPPTPLRPRLGCSWHPQGHPACTKPGGGQSDGRWRLACTGRPLLGTI